MTPHMILWIIVGALIGAALYYDLKRIHDERKWNEFMGRPHKKLMTVEEIVKNYLVDNGFDGLCKESCGCDKDSIFCFDVCGMGCKPAKRYTGPCEDCPIFEFCDNQDEHKIDGVCYVEVE